MRNGTPPSPAPAVQLRQVSKSYGENDNRHYALKDMSIDLARGSFTAIMGPSGSGKSTLLNCAAGLDRPDAGSIVVGEIDLARLSVEQLSELRRDRIGFVFQAYNLLPQLTVMQNITLPLLLAKRKADHSSLGALIAGVGMTGMEGRLPGQLSGGQAQRVAIARSLVTSPEVVFADEPTGALDSAASEQIMTLLQAAVRQMGQTVVMVTHDPHVASYADRVLFLADGQLVAEIEGATGTQIAAQMTQLGRW